MAAELATIPARLRIKVLYSDDDIIVIDKPCDLRSVPGHATPGPQTDDDNGGESDGDAAKIKSKPQRLTAQEAWVKAIKSFAEASEEKDADTSTTPKPDDTQSRAVDELIHNLSITSDTSSIPRKCAVFERYCQRNRRRLLPSFPELDEMPSAPPRSTSQEPPNKRQKQSKSYNIPTELKNIAQIVFSLIQQRQRPLMHLPKPTDDAESAIGQLRLLGYGDYAHNNHGPLETVDDVKKRISDENQGIGALNKFKLHVVHRIDCQTSGVMVVARNPDAASILCEKWRERQSVKKTYLAYVKRWPPYHDQKLLEGRIELPLAASRTERIKWEVRPIEDGGKDSTTIWKINESSLDATEKESVSGLTLDLQPLTGRTHQLRIHCAAVGSGIEGDSLYGDDPIAWLGDKPQHKESKNELEESTPKTLKLHAHKLTFPHPKTGVDVTFESPKPW